MGKSKKAPAPDPRLVEAQIKSMGVQDAATQEILRLSQEQAKQQAELMPLQKEALQFALDSGRTAYEQSQADRVYALGQRDKLDQLTGAMIADANEYDSAAAQARRADASMADVGKAYSDAIAANDRALAAMGVMPGSGRQLALREAAGTDLARQQVGAANEARLQARNEGRLLQDRAAASLAGAPGAVSANMLAGAQLAQSGVGTANAGAGGIYSGYGALTGQQQAAGGLAGSMGANATNMWNAQAQYKLAADQAGKTNWGSALGGAGALLGGVTRVAPLLSDRRTKHDIEQVGFDPRGFGVYTYRFRPEFVHMGGVGVHVGVMADEVANVIPAAVSRGADGFDRVDYAML